MKVLRRTILRATPGLFFPELAAARPRHAGGSLGAPAIPIAINFSPTSPATVYDNSLTATVVNTISVTTSDMSPFTGSLGFAAPNFDASGLVAFSGSNLLLTRGLTGGDDGNHLVTVSATENSVTITNTLTLHVIPPPASINFVTSVTALGLQQNNYGPSLGFSFTVGGQPLTVTDLGRYKVHSGDSGTHSLYILDTSVIVPSGLNPVVPGGFATVNIATATVNTFTYGALPTPITLLAGHTYALISTETVGGDFWGDQGTSLATTADALVTAPVFAGGPAFNQNVGPNGVAGHAYVPLDFKYTVGATTVVTYRGGPNTVINQTAGSINFRVTPAGAGGVVSGTVTLTAQWNAGSVGPAGNITAQWMYDNDQVLSPPITSSNSSGSWFPYTFDTHILSNGTHAIYARVIDSDIQPAYETASMGRPLIVNNAGGSAPVAAQDLYAAFFSIGRTQTPKPVPIHYGAVPNPVNQTYPYPYAFNAPASARGGDPARFRTVTNIAADAINHPRDGEYLGSPQFCTTQGGGVFVSYLDPLIDSGSNNGAYPTVIHQNFPDGTRLNGNTTGISTYVEAPTWLAGPAGWLGCSVEGRVFFIDNHGNPTTLAGYTRDLTTLTIDQNDLTVPEGSITRVLIGTFPTDVDLGGATDLVVDPRNDHVIYVLSQLDNWLAKVTLTGTSLAGGVTAVVTIYAGSPGAADAYVEGTAGPTSTARFAQPIGLAIVGTVRNESAPNGDPVGTIYIADTNNSAIRRINAAGTTVDTLYGGNGTFGPGPVPPTSGQTQATFTVTLQASGGLVWSSTGGGTAAVIALSAVVGAAVGSTVSFDNAVNSGSANINIDGSSSVPKFVITAFTNSTHFSVAMPGTSAQYGTFTGTISIHSYGIDVYSLPGTVSLLGSQGYVAFPGFPRWSSAKHLVLCEFWSDIVRDIDLFANTIRRIGVFDNLIEVFDPPPGNWMGMDCDWAGVLGPVDDIILAKFQSNLSAAHYNWRVGFDSSGLAGSSSYSAETFSDFGSLPSIGQSATLLAGPGHYPWAWSFSRTEGRAISTGTAQGPAAFHRIMEPSDTIVNLQSNTGIDFTKWQHGNAIWIQGTVTAFPWPARPGFPAIWGQLGANSVLGYTFDDLMVNGPLGNFASSTPGDSGDVNLANFIRNGALTGVVRPEITGNDMRDLIYFIRRNTLAGSGPVPGGPLVVPGADDPDVVPPVILTLSAIRNSSTQVTVTWTVDKSTIGLAMAGGPSQAGFAWPQNVPSPIETAFVTGGATHTAVISGIATGVSPVSVVVIAKDSAGNCVYSSPISVSP